MVQQLSTNTFGTAKWIVSPTASDGTHTTIASALTSASSGDTIFIRPGTYTENLTLKAGVNLAAYDCDAQNDQTIISGKCSMSASGAASISGIILQTNGDYCIEMTGTSPRIELTNVKINATNNTAINNTSTSGALNMYYSKCAITQSGAAFCIWASGGNCNIFYTQITTGAGIISSTISSGVVQIVHSFVGAPFTTSSTGSAVVYHTFMNCSGLNLPCLTIGGSGGGAAYNCFMSSGNSAVVVVNANYTLSECVIDSIAANAITGSATLKYGGVSFTNTSAITTTGQTPSDIGPRVQLGDGIAGTGGCQVMSGTGSPSGAVTAPKGSLFLRTDGTTTNDRAYINTDAGTTWTAIVTVA